MESQQLVETSSPNSQDLVLPKPANSIPRHSIDAILGRGQKRKHQQDIEEATRDPQESTGKFYSAILLQKTFIIQL